MNELNSLLEEYADKFGIELDKRWLYRKGKWALLCTPAAQAYGKGELIGLKIAKLDGYFKMSTAICQLIGKNASRRVIELSKEDAELVIKGESITTSYTANGFYILKYKGYSLAIGRVKNNAIDPLIRKSIQINKDYCLV